MHQILKGHKYQKFPCTGSLWGQNTYKSTLKTTHRILFCNCVIILCSTGSPVRGSKPGGSEIFRTRPERPWGPYSLLYNGYRVSFPGVKRPGRGVNHPPLSRAEVKERVQLYLYSPSGPLWPVLGRTLPS